MHNIRNFYIYDFLLRNHFNMNRSINLFLAHNIISCLIGKSKKRVMNAQCSKVFNLRYSDSDWYCYDFAKSKGQRQRLRGAREKFQVFLFSGFYVTTPKLITQMAGYSNSMSGKLTLVLLLLLISSYFFHSVPFHSFPMSLVHFHCIIIFIYMYTNIDMRTRVCVYMNIFFVSINYAFL